MAILSRDILKSYFRTGAYPTEEQFAALIDSFRHYLDEVPMSKVTGLTEALNSKASADISSVLNQMLEAAQTSAQSANSAAATATAVQTDYTNNIKPEIRAALSVINDLVGIDKLAVFDENTDYAKNSLVLYDDKLYLFTTDHTAGTWSASEVSQTSMLEILDTWARVTLPGYLEQINATDAKANTVLTVANNTVIESQKTLSLNRLAVGSEVIPEFDASNMYEVNSLIMYNGVLYKWLVQHEEGVGWNTTDVKETSLYNEYLYLNGINTTREQVDLRLTANKGTPSFTNCYVTVELSSVSLMLSTVTLGTSDGDKTITFGQDGTATFTVNIDDDGYVKFEVPFGVTYNIVCPDIVGYHTPQLGNKSAYLVYRILGVKYIYKVTTPGIYVVFEDGTLVLSSEFEQFITDNPNTNLETAVMIYCASDALISRSCCFGVKIDDIIGKVMPSVSFGARGYSLGTLTGYLEKNYDGLKNTENLLLCTNNTSAAAKYALGRNLLIGASSLKGFIPARFQFDLLYNNRTTIDTLIALLRPSSSVDNACSAIFTSSYQKTCSTSDGVQWYYTNSYVKDGDYYSLSNSHLIFTAFQF